MARPARQSTSDLIASVAAPESGVDFFAGVRKLEAAAGETLAGPARAVPARLLGMSKRSRDDLVRFGQNPNVGFRSTGFDGVDMVRGVPVVKLNCYGLLAPTGPLPLAWTYEARDRSRKWDQDLRRRDDGLSRFLDIFNHRWACHLYRAWASACIAVHHDRADPAAVRSFDKYVGSLAGLGTPSAAVDDAQLPRDAVHHRHKLFYIGRLAAPTRNPEGLVSILRGYFVVPVSVEEFVGRWIDLPEESRCRMSATSPTAQLGRTTIAGSRIYDVQSMFRLRIGPLSLRDYERLLPGGESMKRLAAWIRSYIGDELDVQIQLILRKDQVPKLKLGGSVRLGMTTWATTAPPADHLGDLLFTADIIAESKIHDAPMPTPTLTPAPAHAGPAGMLL